METRRWLLPFTHEINMVALDSAVSLAESVGATLIGVSLISASHMARSKSGHLEAIQQSSDFLRTLQCKAARRHVPLECYEVSTVHVLQSIKTLVHERQCDGIILVAGAAQVCLLQDHEMRSLLIEPPTKLVMIRLSSSPESIAVQPSVISLLAWLRRLWWKVYVYAP